MIDSFLGATPDSLGEDTKSWTSRQLAIAIALTVVGYWAGARLGLLLTFGQQPVSILWPPNAILLASLLVAPKRVWWLLLIAALPAHLFVELGGGIPASMALCWFVSNCVEALLGATLVRRFSRGRPRLDSIRSFGVFLIGATFLSTFLSSFLDAAFVSLNRWGGEPYWRVWQTRFSSNLLATQTIVPVVLAYNSKVLRGLLAMPVKRMIEAMALATAILVVSIVAFVQPAGAWPVGPALLYAPLPFLLWAAVRFGWRGTSVAIATVTFFAIWGAGRGGGPFTTAAPADDAVSAQLFLFLAAVPLSMIAVVMEERRRAVEEARNSQRLLALTINAAHVGVWSTDLESGQNWANDLLASIFGLLPSDVGDHSAWIQRIHADDRASAEADFWGAQCPNAPRDERGDSPIPETEFRVQHIDGSVRWILARGAVLRREDGQPYRATGIGIDITERRRTADAMRENDDRMALAAASVDIGFWSIDVATDDIWLSQHCYVLLGLPRLTKITRSLFQSLLQLAALAGDGASIDDMREHEFRIVRPGGEERWLCATARRVGFAGDRSLRIIGVLRDITEQRKAADEARERHQELSHLARVATIGELSATIVHELGQPIGAVMFNAQAASAMLERGGADESDIREILRDIVRDNQRAGDVINQLRKMLRRDEIKRERLDLRQVVREALDLVQGELSKQGIEVKLNFSSDLPTVVGNRAQLQQVLLNVILNARDAMDDVAPERRKLRISVTRSADSTVDISVADTGPGITVERLGHLFEPFFTSKAKGLGLGLAISRSIMLDHGGDLRAETNGDGAVLRLSLPSLELADVQLRPMADRELRSGVEAGSQAAQSVTI